MANATLRTFTAAGLRSTFYGRYISALSPFMRCLGMFFLAQLAQDICEHSFSFRLSTFSIKLLRMPLGSEMLSCFSYHYFSSWHFWVYSTLTHLVAYLWHVHLCCSLAVLCVRALLFLLFDPVPSPDWLLWDRAPEKFPPLPS